MRIRILMSIMVIDQIKGVKLDHATYNIKTLIESYVHILSRLVQTGSIYLRVDRGFAVLMPHAKYHTIARLGNCYFV